MSVISGIDALPNQAMNEKCKKNIILFYDSGNDQLRIIILEDLTSGDYLPQSNPSPNQWQ